MIKRRIPALLLALTPILMSAHSQAEDIQQIDPVAAINEKISLKNDDIKTVEQDAETQTTQLNRLLQKRQNLKQESSEFATKRNRAKTALDKQYNRLTEEPDIDLTSFQKQYQESWQSVKENQKAQLENEQLISENEMQLSLLKQKKARLTSEQQNLQESKIEARVKRLSTELREGSVLETHYQTTCSTTMTLGECANQGKYLTKQKAVKTFKNKLLANLTESNLVKQNLQGVQLNIHVQESQFIKSGFSGNNGYYTEMQAQLQAKPEAVASCKLLNVEARYCLTNSSAKGKTVKKDDKQWANVTVRSDQYNDDVTINGVKYGSTPVEIVLPTGRHQVTVAKDGYETYNRAITVNGSDTVWVKLRPQKDG
ncbi:PEGA domain-containing protein [Vibrio tapetis subsp. quintayensis]|uniref:PEGA domain-containing protein n=1 Tax=Vibrio tapetis TaxID=52443 RepID=UPI0025B41E0D|nr:PEGA domain-containing protein [Vibrio tapetis]MDN3680792.1 PEGA domain-containing protein [Vibrio tapetis subsp. quintayensis]